MSCKNVSENSAELSQLKVRQPRLLNATSSVFEVAILSVVAYYQVILTSRLGKRSMPCGTPLGITRRGFGLTVLGGKERRPKPHLYSVSLAAKMSQEMKNEATQLNGTPASGSAQTKKREDYLEWPEYFMAVAFLSAQRSKDPSSQVGACIVNQENKIVGIGYNGMPNGCDDDLLPWSCSADDRLDTKYPYVCHAELNAIMNKNSADVKGCSMYVALFPCNECAKLIIQAGIKDVIYLSDKYHDIPEMTASRRLLNLAGIQYKRVTMQSDGTRKSCQRNLDG
ncbi:deoxycytidylate deaminase-like isoform X3 [Oncorhynchus keta]|uniref:deoxycytidylate deaminase-like isoform X3 n=1 Tax=Oncorhynchus keta TaxID=8018 RepID=UPI00227AD3C6|nr:deoxycytidylate deaminase-like isoform X3 [Oncorhynchus keta]